jgi:DNA modification methylase
MIERIIRACFDPSDVVLDCFDGSGSTQVAAHSHGRGFISIEIEPEYHEIAMTQLGRLTMQSRTLSDPSRAPEALVV